MRIHHAITPSNNTKETQVCPRFSNWNIGEAVDGVLQWLIDILYIAPNGDRLAALTWDVWELVGPEAQVTVRGLVDEALHCGRVGDEGTAGMSQKALQVPVDTTHHVHTHANTHMHLICATFMRVIFLNLFPCYVNISKSNIFDIYIRHAHPTHTHQLV